MTLWSVLRKRGPRAPSVLNIHLIRALSALRFRCQAAISETGRSRAPMRMMKMPGSTSRRQNSF